MVESKNKKKKSAKKQIPIKTFVIRMPVKFWDKLQEQQDLEEFPTANKFLLKILKDYLEFGPYEDRYNPINEDLQEYRGLVEELKENVGNLGNILNMAKDDPEPADFEFKVNQIKLALNDHRLSLTQIHNTTSIPEFEIMVILGKLYDAGRIAFDEKFRYYKL